MNSSAQLQRKEEEQLGQEQADDEVAVNGIRIGLQAVDHWQTSERSSQEDDTGH